MEDFREKMGNFRQSSREFKYFGSTLINLFKLGQFVSLE